MEKGNRGEMKESKRIVVGELNLLKKYSDVGTEEFEGFREGFQGAGAVLINRLSPTTHQIQNFRYLKIFGEMDACSGAPPVSEDGRNGARDRMRWREGSERV